MRKEFRIQNDGRSFSLLSKDRVEAFAESGETEPFVKEEKLIAVDLGADDYFTGLLVLNEALSPLESSQWIAQLSRPLRVLGQGIVIAGGCDPDSFHSWLDNKPIDEPTEFQEVVPFDIPDGKYMVDIYAYIGSHAADEAIFEGYDEDEPYKTYATKWFQGPFPSGLYDEALDLAKEDPNAEKIVALVKRGAAQVVDFGSDNALVIGYLFHLTEWEAELTDQSGWIEFKHSQIPEACPLSLPSRLAAPNY